MSSQSADAPSKEGNAEEVATSSPLSQEDEVKEETITSDRQQEIEAAVEELNSVNKIEVTEEAVESKDENVVGNVGEGRHVYKECLKNKQIVYVVGKLQVTLAPFICRDM